MFNISKNSQVVKKSDSKGKIEKQTPSVAASSGGRMADGGLMPWLGNIDGESSNSKLFDQSTSAHQSFAVYSETKRNKALISSKEK